MNERIQARPTAGALAALLLASGCSGQTASSGIPSQNAARARVVAPLAPPQIASVRRAIAQKSRVNRAIAKGRLLYVADLGANAVYIYTYPQLSGAGEISGFASVDGICTDRRGYVWVLDTSDVVAWEFAHGGTEPINYLQPGDSSGNPGIGYGCSVNPRSGDLAVAGSAAGFTVFRNGQSTHTTYWDGAFFDFDFIGYDGSGNLYIDGALQPYFQFGLDKLPAGSSTVSQIALGGGSISGPGGIQWDGKYLDIADGSNGTIYQTDGASIVGSISTTAGCQKQFFILANHRRVIAPDPCNADTGVYAYPAGGSPIKTASGGQVLPWGVAISVASK